jgi:phosphoglycolate phosphatase
VVTPEEVSAPKPDPAHLRAVLAALDTGPADAVMVGDSANDVAVARAAGTAVVAVSYGYPRMDPKKLGADLLIDAMSELPAALQRLTSAARTARPASLS